MGRRHSDLGLLGPSSTRLRLTDDALRGAPTRPHAIIAVIVMTAMAFVVGGAARDVVLAAVRQDASLVQAFFPLLLPIVLQAAIGYGALAMLLRGRYPASSIWIIGIMATTVLMVPTLAVNGVGVFPVMAGLSVSLLPGVAIGLLLRIEGAVWKVAFTYLIGSTVAMSAFAFFGYFNLTGLAVSGDIADIAVSYQQWQASALADNLLNETLIVYSLVGGQLLAAATTTIGTVLQDFLAGATAAVGISWALGPARLKDGTIIRYLPAKNFTTEIRSTAASDGLDY